jgi:Kef-type K+ transport system membrane component KefB
MSIGILICLFGFIKAWKKIFLFLFCLTSAFLFSIDYYNNGTNWFWPMALPITTVTFGLVFLAALLIKNKKPGGLYNSGIIFTGIAVLIILIELILDLNSGEVNLTWSIQVFITAFSLALVILIARKMIHNSSFKRLKRFLHF